MDKYQENEEGFKKTSTLNKTDSLKGRLMIIHGSIDPTVVWQNSQMFINKCIENDVLIDYMIYPNHEHNVGGKDRVHLTKTIIRYFNEHL
jgi:dipeptidyl aminopeptidase/acylaminoacyl peptidase